MTKDELSKFCGERKGISTPFSEGEFTFATDGKFIIRVTRMEDVPERSDAPKNMLKNIFDLWPHCEAFTPLKNIEFPELEGPSECETCRGYGEHQCDKCDDNHDCGKCEGSGKRPEKGKSVPFGKHLVSHLILNKIQSLPDVELAESSKDEYCALAFRFDGGDGRIMPMRRDS